MVGKVSHKKQVLTTYEKDNDSVVVDLTSIVGESQNVPDSILWIEDLVVAKTCTEQIRIIQQNKKKTRATLLDEAFPTQSLESAVPVLLRMYILPQYFPFHIALDWVVVLMKDLEASRPQDIKAMLFSISLDILDQYKAASEEKEVGKLLAWQTAFSSLILLDRDLDFFCQQDPSGAVILNCISYLLDQVVFLQSIESGRLTAPELVRWTCCCTDCFRNISNLFKSHLEEIVTWKNSLDWSNKVKLIQEQALLVLKDDSAKDSISAAAATLILSRYVIYSLGGEEGLEHIANLISSVLSAGVERGEEWASVSRIARCGLIREAIVLFSPKLWNLLVEEKLMGKSHSFILQTCEDSSSLVQLYGLQSLEVWLQALTKSSVEEIDAQETLPYLLSTLTLLCRAWTHPVRQVNHIIPDIFDRLLAVFGFINGSDDETWSSLVMQEVMRMPAQHRGKYQALKAILGAISSEAMLSAYPRIIAELVLAMKERDVAASVSSLLNALLVKFVPAVASETVGEWRKSILAALASENPHWRANVSDYLLPDLMKIDLFSPQTLLHILWSQYQEESSAPLLSGLIAIVLSAKAQGLTIPGQEEILSTAALSADDVLRFNALIATTASLKTSLPVDKKEFEALKGSLTFSLKTLEADHCSKFVRTIKNLLLRCRDSNNLSQRNSKTSKHAQKKKNGGEVDSAVVVATAAAEGNLISLSDVLPWLLHEVQENLYPGVTFDREISSLTILETVFSTLASSPSESAQLIQLVDERLVTSLLKSFVSNWDRSRVLAASLLDQLPRPWPAFHDAKSLEGLLGWALTMAESARLRESDAGAQLLCNVFTAYSLDLAWKIDLHGVVVVEFQGRQKTSEEEEESAEGFILSLVRRLEKNLTALDQLFDFLSAASSSIDRLDTASALSKLDLAGDFPLGHGLLLAIKLCIQATRKKRGLSPRWRQTLSTARTMAIRSLELAMKVVAEAATDVPFAPTPSSGAKGPVNTATAYSMAASYVNTNTFAPVVNDDSGGSGGMEGGEDTAKAQRGIVAAWLLVKEASALLAGLVDAAPIPQGRFDDLLTVNEVENIGQLLLQALGRLKHMGAIAEAHMALQAVVTTLIRYGDANLHLSRLPGLWLDNLLDRLHRHQQVFILRRSAGFAYSFLSLLRAEPANSPPVLLLRTLPSLLSLVKKGLANETDADGQEWWRLSVHALNVLRIIMLDSHFGPELDNFLSETFMCAVKGFRSEHWAIRNSSMMVFSATIQRSISREKNDSANASSVTAIDYFSRYKDLLPFLALELEEAVQREAKEEYDVLYPILLLFAKFRAPLTLPTAISEEGINFQPVLDLIMSCCSNMKMLTRSISARAYTALIAVEEIPKHFQICLERLLSVKSTNALHGYLLVALEMLQQIAKQRKLSMDQQAMVFRTIAGQLAAHRNKLNELSTIVNRRRCPPLHYVFLQLQHAFLVAVGKDAVDEDRDLLLQNCAFCVNYLGLRNSTPLSVYCDTPWAPLLARQAVEWLVSLQHIPEGNAELAMEWIVDEILPLLRSNLSEVRDGVSAGLISLFASDILLDQVASLPGMVNMLQAVVESAKVEKQPASLDLQVQLLHLLVEVYYQQITSPDSSLTNALCEVSTELLTFETIKASNTSEVQLKNRRTCASWLLEIHSYSCRPVFDGLLSAQTSSSVHVAQRWLAFMQQAGDEEQPIALRLAVAKSLGVNRMLNAFLRSPSSQSNLSKETLILCLEQFLLALDLLQDDDDEVREQANVVCCSWLHSLAGTLEGDVSIYKSKWVSTVTYTLHQMSCVVKVLTEAALSSAFAGEVVQKMWNRVAAALGSFDRLSAMLDTNVEQLQTMSKKIFEAEQANLFRENLPLLTALLRGWSSVTPQHAAHLLDLLQPHVLPVTEHVGQLVSKLLSGRSGDDYLPPLSLAQNSEVFHFLAGGLQLAKTCQVLHSSLTSSVLLTLLVELQTDSARLLEEDEAHRVLPQLLRTAFATFRGD
eukprot:gene6011-6621_t